MRQVNESAGTIFTRIFNAIGSLLTTGSIHAKEAADSLRDTEVVLSQAGEQVEEKAQRMTQAVDDAVTNYRVLFNKVQRQQKIVDIWGQKAEDAYRASIDPKNVAHKDELEVDSRRFLAEQQKQMAILAPWKQHLEESKPAYEAALKAFDQAGFDKAVAESEIDTLKAEAASADVQRKLAAAFDRGEDSQLRALLDEAHSKIDQETAANQADAELDARRPKDLEEADYEITKAQQDSAVEDSFQAMVARLNPSATAPADPAA